MEMIDVMFISSADVADHSSFTEQHFSNLYSAALFSILRDYSSFDRSTPCSGVANTFQRKTSQILRLNIWLRFQTKQWLELTENETFCGHGSWLPKQHLCAH